MTLSNSPPSNSRRPTLPPRLQHSAIEPSSMSVPTIFRRRRRFSSAVGRKSEEGNKSYRQLTNNSGYKLPEEPRRQNRTPCESQARRACPCLRRRQLQFNHGHQYGLQVEQFQRSSSGPRELVDMYVQFLRYVLMLGSLRNFTAALSSRSAIEVRPANHLALVQRRVGTSHRDRSSPSEPIAAITVSSRFAVHV